MNSPPGTDSGSRGNIWAAVSIVLGLIGIFIAGIILGIIAIIIGAYATSKNAKVTGAIGMAIGFIAFVAALLVITGVV
jgi:hypothetical protein